MAAIRGIKKILKSDLVGADSWFDPVISVINEFLDTVIGALRGRLTLADNFYGVYKEFNFTHGEELQILTDFSTYNGVLLVKPPNKEDGSTYGVDGWNARQVKTKTIGITVYFNGAGSTTGKVGFFILG